MRWRLLREEPGFTLVELIITMIIIGVLAAIALPAFLGERATAQDADAKASARILMTYMDTCYAPDEDFRKCSTQAEAGADDIDWGIGPGQVSVTNTTKDSYEVVAISQAASGGANNSFTIKRDFGRPVERTCTGNDGCRNGTW